MVGGLEWKGFRTGTGWMRRQGQGRTGTEVHFSLYICTGMQILHFRREREGFVIDGWLWNCELKGQGVVRVCALEAYVDSCSLFVFGERQSVLYEMR